MVPSDFSVDPMAAKFSFLCRVSGGGEFFHVGGGCLFIRFVLRGRRSASVLLRSDVPRKDPRKLILLIFSYQFFYLGGQLIQDPIQLPDCGLFTGFLRIILMTRLFLCFVEGVLSLFQAGSSLRTPPSRTLRGFVLISPAERRSSRTL